MLFDVTFLAHPQPRDCGDYRHRTLWPAQALGEHVPTIAVQTIHPDVFTAIVQSRLLVVGMIVDNEVHALLEYRRSVGLPTVYEISDDFKAFPENTSLGTLFYARPEIQAQIESMAKTCDAVQFSSPVLAEKYAYLNDNQAVFMNQAWTVPNLHAPPQNKAVRVGWTASGGHLADAQDLARLLAHAKARDPQLFQDFTLCLMTTPRNAQAFTDAGLAFEHTPTGSFEHYMQFISGLDAGLAHLTPDAFAQGRSDGKYIEYASRGVPAICHASGTYASTIRHGANGLLYTDEKSFRSALSNIVRVPEIREHIRNQAHTDIKQSRNHRTAAMERFNFYRELVEQSQDSPFSQSISPFAQQGFHSLEHSYEQEFFAAMNEHNQGPQPATIQRYHRLSQQEPSAWKVWERFAALYRRLGLHEHLELLESRCEEAKQTALERAFERAA